MFIRPQVLARSESLPGRWKDYLWVDVPAQMESMKKEADQCLSSGIEGLEMVRGFDSFCGPAKLNRQIL